MHSTKELAWSTHRLQRVNLTLDIAYIIELCRNIYYMHSFVGVCPFMQQLYSVSYNNVCIHNSSARVVAVYRTRKHFCHWYLRLLSLV